MNSSESSLYIRRFHLLINCCENPLVVIDEEGRIKEFNSHFLKIFSKWSNAQSELKGESIFPYLDRVAGNEINKILRQRSMVGNFRFDGGIVVGGNVVHYKFKVNYYCDDNDTIREIMIVLEPSNDSYDLEPDSLIRYLGEVFLPNVPLTSQIISPNKKVIYSVNWNDLPSPLKQIIAPNERICCYLLKKSISGGECICERVIREKRTSIEEVCLENGSDKYWLAVVVIPLSGEDDSIYGVLVTVDNISEERKLARSVEEYISFLQKNSMESQLIPTLVRHLREPVSYILGAISLLLEESNQKNSRILVKIKAKCEECKEIIDQVSNFSGELSEAFIKAEVCALIRSMVMPVFSKLEDKNVIFRFNPSPVFIYCVPYQFAQALIAIIENGVRHATQDVVVNLDSQGKDLIITIDDDGKGIPIEYRSRVFVPFFTTEREKGHLGLGLSLARSIIESVGGYISVEKSELGGAKFIVRVPIVEVVSMGQVKKEVSECNILIIEDDEDLADILKTSLEKEGYNVFISKNCEEAKELINSIPISIVILDLLFSERPTGVEFYEYITQKEKFPERKIIVITGDSASPTTSKFLKNMKSPYLEKPFDFDELKLMIAQIV